MAIFDALFGRKKKGSAFDPRVGIAQLAQMSPPSTLLYMPGPGGDADEEPDDLGKAFFLRRDKQDLEEGEASVLSLYDPELRRQSDSADDAYHFRHVLEVDEP